MYLCGVGCYFSSFISYFIWIFSLFLVSLVKGLSILSFQKTSPWFHWSFLLLFWSLFYFISSLIFIISFLLLTLCFVSLFLILLGGRLGRLFEIFLVSWGRPVLLKTSLVKLLLLHPIDFGKLCLHFHLSPGIFWKQPKCPSTDEWIEKMWCVCVCVCVSCRLQQCGWT